MSCHQRRGNVEVLAALAAITGQSDTDMAEEYHEATREYRDMHYASSDEVEQVLRRIKTRLGLAPAVDPDQARDLAATLDALLGDPEVTITRSHLFAWDRLLRHTPEHVPAIDRLPVVLPQLPSHQAEMWKTVLGLESLGHPWVLVGGQMTMLHCLENGIAPTRPTDDGDVVVGVWTRRDALTATSRFLRSCGFAEDKTSDGYGYRYRRDEDTVIDVLLPEGLERQHAFPRTTSGRPGFSMEGGRQALARAERVPIIIDDATGQVRRPNLLGSLVVKAHAYVTDSRDVDRHAEDLVTLGQIGLNDPRAVLQHARPGDRKVLRRFLRRLTPDHRYFQAADDPEAVYALLDRLANPQEPA